MILRFVEGSINALDIEPKSLKRVAVLSAFGLAEVLDGARLVTRGANTGPGGNAGTVIFSYDDELRDADAARIGFYPKTQDWTNCGQYWCGKYKGETIAPDDLRKESGRDGAKIRLGDGNDWEIAQALYGLDGGATALPRKLRLVNGRTEFNGVVDALADFDKQARAFWNEWMLAIDEKRNARYEYDAMIALACAGLGVNYRVSAVEAVNVLGLFDESNIWEACKATIGWPTIQEMLKSIADAEKKNIEATIPT